VIRYLDMPAVLRNFNVMNKGDIDFFFGSGASVQAGIPTGGGMVWEFKREIYCTETETSQEKFKDLQSQYAQKILQDYFDEQGNHPLKYDPAEYSHYFELCYNTSTARERFIQKKVKNISPSLGHLCLADLFIDKKIQCIWTTNFDELIEAGINTLKPEHSFTVFSSANSASLLNGNLRSFSSIFKLHGDYRYDKIKNTLKELQALETSMHDQFKKRLYERGIIFIGYSGSDDSIMHILEEHIDEPGFLKYGLIWMIPTGASISDRVSNLMERACNANESSCIVEIPGFDELMYRCYKLQNKPNELIEGRWIDYPQRKKPLSFSGNFVDSFIKLNTFVSTSYPLCKGFDTDITSWKELRSILGNSSVIAALFARRIYCFDDEDTIRKIFDGHICSDINEEKVSDKILYKYDSIYTGMLYALIRKRLVDELGLCTFGKNKYYDPQTFTEYNRLYKPYDGIEISLSIYSGRYYLSIVPTVYVERLDGKGIERLQKQKVVNQIKSKLYNKQYDEKLRYWNKKLLNSVTRTISFSYKDFMLNFISIYLSGGGLDRKPEWPSIDAYQYAEPEMLFNVNNDSCRAINQLKGIIKYGPIDYSYSKQKPLREAIKLAIISPSQQQKKIFAHLNALNQQSRPHKMNDGFLPLYNGFESIYRRGIQVPAESDASRVITYDEKMAIDLDTKSFVHMMKGFIDKLASQYTFDVAVIYIPSIFAKFRESQNLEDDFNLHDALKLYATDKGIKLQFIEERSINTYDPCKVLWGLSTSLYAKAAGVLWQPIVLNNSTAFVGVSYAQSKSKGICIGCSQLFDSTGTGIRLLLRKINDPAFYGKNPFMKSDEARATMSALREQYYKCNPTAQLNRIVIHKTTHFTREEILGFTQALEGIDDIELLQIQEFSSWRAIRFGTKAADGAYNFSVKRGTTIPLNSYSFLLWTHGCIIHNELKGNLNYYKGGRGIPSPLLVKRFYGKAPGDVLIREILMLSKMNWNSGDSLYKQLPVTLDFAKILSRMAKQDEAIYDKAYDFRYFM
jgi:hypothetical protein